jgi:hypothetical protein
VRRWIAPALGLCALAGYAGWLLGHPASLGSDDALFFVRSVDHFSVLEFSPHFPGYPAFVLGARLIDLATGAPATAVFLLSAGAGLSIPLAVYAWVRAGGGAAAFALAAAACALLQPVLPALSLSMLSDPLGLALMLWHLVALRRGRFASAGLLLGLALAARPSYAVMALASAACVALRRREQLPAFLAAFAAVGIASALFVLGADGLGYVSEGWRFVSGHFAIWGRGLDAASGASWPAVVSGLVGGYAGLALGAAALALGARGLDLRGEVAELAAAAMLGSYALWMVCAQNPDSARHAAPLIFLGVALACTGLARAQPRLASAAVLGLLLVQSLRAFTSSVDLARSPPPLARASRALSGHPGALLITQRGVETLRAEHPELRILDGYYDASSRLAARTARTPVLRLSAAALAERWEPIAQFPARFPGETALALYAWRPEPEEKWPGKRPLRSQVPMRLTL